MEIVRDRRRLRFPTAEEALFVGDVVLVEGEPDDVLRLTQVEGVEFASERDFAPGRLQADDEQATVLELVAGPSFSNRGRSIAAMRFRNRFGGLVLGIWRQGTNLRTRLRDQRIETGDVLMVRMPSARVPDLEESTDFIVLSQRSRVVVPRPRMLVPLAILVLVVGLAAANVAHIAVAGILGAVLMVVTRVLPYDRIYAAVEWRTLVLIAALLPLGTAMQTTGLARKPGAGRDRRLATPWTNRRSGGHLHLHLAADSAHVQRRRGGAGCADRAGHRRQLRHRAASRVDDGRHRRLHGLHDADRPPVQRAHLQHRRVPVYRLHQSRRTADAPGPHRLARRGPHRLAAVDARTLCDDRTDGPLATRLS